MGGKLVTVTFESDCHLICVIRADTQSILVKEI